MNNSEIMRRLMEVERRQQQMELTNQELIAEIAKLNSMIAQLAATTFAQIS
jgi:hypothetical protein